MKGPSLRETARWLQLQPSCGSPSAHEPTRNECVTITIHMEIGNICCFHAYKTHTQKKNSLRYTKIFRAIFSLFLEVTFTTKLASRQIAFQWIEQMNSIGAPNIIIKHTHNTTQHTVCTFYDIYCILNDITHIRSFWIRHHRWNYNSWLHLVSNPNLGGAAPGVNHDTRFVIHPEIQERITIYMIVPWNVRTVLLGSGFIWLYTNSLWIRVIYPQQGLYSLSGKTSYRQILRSLEAVTLNV